MLSRLSYGPPDSGKSISANRQGLFEFLLAMGRTHEPVVIRMKQDATARRFCIEGVPCLLVSAS